MQIKESSWQRAGCSGVTREICGSVKSESEVCPGLQEGLKENKIPRLVPYRVDLRLSQPWHRLLAIQRLQLQVMEELAGIGGKPESGPGSK
jgi:hypothetical protein